MADLAPLPDRCCGRCASFTPVENGPGRCDWASRLPRPVWASRPVWHHMKADRGADCATFVSRPHRIQRQRTRGWRMPAGAVSVDRNSRWGNPFLTRTWGRVGAVNLFRTWLDDPAQAALREAGRADLRGRVLACWCPLDGAPCHGDVWLEIANAG